MSEYTPQRLRELSAVLRYSTSGVAVAAIAAYVTGNPVWAVPLVPWIAGLAAYAVTSGEQADEDEEDRIQQETER